MKNVLIIPDGAADAPLEQLDGRTAFEAAKTPNLDALSGRGRLGTARTTPRGMPCGSDVCTMSLLGYDPARYHTGRAPLEAAAGGVAMGPQDWVFRVNLVHIADQRMRDHSAGHISSGEGARLMADFAERFDRPGFRFHPGVSYRNLMTDVSERGRAEGEVIESWDRVKTTPPHDILEAPIRRHLPVGGPLAEDLTRLIAESEVFLRDHEVNRTRRENGELPATHLWPWGQGRKPAMPTFEQRFGKRGAMITAVDLLAGIGSFLGLDRLDVPGQTSYHDNDYAATGRHAAEAIAGYDFLVVHVEAPDEASHAGDAATKVKAIEAIDRHVVGPVVDALKAARGDDGEWRVLVMPDHHTRVSTRMHDPTPVPFLLAGYKVGGVVRRTLTEKNAEASDLHVQHGHELMELFLRRPK
ncbi:cofactor-independent phosphoglycerate mutase [Phycisphaera mikurensis]|uniref:2,3-bisphosphoglycerate-independent phosphoglycerate mutase n=1 Tax=Phycisphaera mikurensis (strain NBRC 102666 / KCTC 22515 / FYK2301M01) TaxID=1142394 RepID=I0IE32_PHYMF|nr:cofactor-independent phosphoglycerate mutase [Phycisphaera mikurensis]MBB6441325.1 2,3-bisphosphoglycerate-independent phosphoglycerate mutase [Phycisphaera mikurensis]BAM03520.1 2,3-bisphosphoglycerate-independent phosphoglycerate mutase [Phycisphaera mikurensis NBRC 102666]